MGIPLRRANQARRTGQKKTLCSAPQKTTPSGQQVVRRDRPLRNAQSEHSCANLHEQSFTFRDIGKIDS